MKAKQKKEDKYNPSIFKLLNKRLMIGVMVFAAILYLINVVTIALVYEDAQELLLESQAQMIVDNFELTLTKVREGMEEVATDPLVIDLLNQKPDNEEFQNYLPIMKSILTGMDILSTNISYMGKAFIANLKNYYIVKKEDVEYSVNLAVRPWYKEVINNPSNTVLTSIHSDLFTDSKTMSLVTKVRDTSNEVIGFIIVDIYVEDLLEYINSSYELIQVAYDDMDQHENVISNKEGKGWFDKVTSMSRKYKKEISVRKKIFENKIGLVFNINEESHNMDIPESIMLSSLGVFYIGINILIIKLFIKVMRRVFVPLNKNIELLKYIVQKNAEEPISLENLDEFQQLESLTNSIYSSINTKIKETRQLIYYDSLTGLPNRYFLETEVAALIRSQETFVLIFIDLENFKDINNIYGYSIGDTTLSVFGKKVQEILGNEGMIFRYSGDEFVAIYTGDTDKKSFLETYKAKGLDKGHIHMSINELAIEVSFTVGCAVYPEDGIDISELLKNSYFIADENKKNRNEKSQLDIFFNPKLYDRMLRGVEIKNSFKEALLNQEFELYFQPIYNCNEIIKCEVLIRWFSNKFGFISPLEFISYAEEIGQIIPLGNWIIEESFKYYNIIGSKCNKNIEFSINVSGLQLCENGFAQRIQDMADIYGINRSNIIFEITENILIHHNETVMNNLNTLKIIGFKIALDDFGTGYSSFSYLERFPLDILKIDKSFIEYKVKREEYEIVRQLINIAHALNLEVVVEGVETKEQYDILESIGCDYYQGYYFSKPLDFENFVEYIKRNPKK